MKTILKSLVFGLIFLSTHATAAQSEKAKVDFSINKDGKNIKLAFATKAGDGLKVNPDGPWKLEIKQIKGVKAATTTFNKDAWQADISGFKVAGTPEAGAKEIEVQYKMTTFVCTVDKTMCYREVVEGKGSAKL